jgi:hypothetical protein
MSGIPVKLRRGNDATAVKFHLNSGSLSDIAPNSPHLLVFLNGVHNSLHDLLGVVPGRDGCPQWGGPAHRTMAVASNFGLCHLAVTLAFLLLKKPLSPLALPSHPKNAFARARRRCGHTHSEISAGYNRYSSQPKNRRLTKAPRWRYKEPRAERS